MSWTGLVRRSRGDNCAIAQAGSSEAGQELTAQTAE